MGFWDALKALAGLQAITKKVLQSVGRQAHQRALVAKLVLQGQTAAHDNGAMWVGGVSYPCGFLNEADAQAFGDRLALHRAQGTQLLSVVSYSDNSAHYQLNGWVKTIVPPRCNAYYYDWQDEQLRIIIDLGAINSL
jgi:hypothetical protein